jgi:hypothetical protein
MGIAVLICLVLASVVALVVTDRVRKEEKPERKDGSALDYVNTFISTLYIVLLALIVVVQWQNVNEINADVGSEASTLTALVQTADRMPGQEGVTVRASAIDYAKAVLAHEWPPPADTNGDAAALALNTGEKAVTHPVALETSLGTIEDQAIGEYQTLPGRPRRAQPHHGADTTGARPAGGLDRLHRAARLDGAGVPRVLAGARPQLALPRRDPRGLDPAQPVPGRARLELIHRRPGHERGRRQGAYRK